MNDSIQALRLRTQASAINAALPETAGADFHLVRAAAPAAAQGQHKVMFIVDDVAGWEALAAAATPDTDVVVLRAGGAGVAAMADYLDGVAPGSIDAVHLVSHGTQAAIAVGADRFDSATLAAHAAQLARIGAALTDDGDFLVYACDAGAGADGRLLVNGIAALTRADVAASDNLTGAAALGGDWTLEVRSDGAQLDTAPIDAQAYAGVLAVNKLVIPGAVASGSMTSSVLKSADGNVYVAVTNDAEASSTTTVFKWDGAAWTSVAAFTGADLGNYQYLRAQVGGAVDANGKIYLVTGGVDWVPEENALSRSDAKLAVYDGTSWRFQMLEEGKPAPSVMPGVVMSISNVSVSVKANGIVDISYHRTSDEQANVFVTNASGAFVSTVSDNKPYDTFTNMPWTLRQVDGIGGHSYVLQSDTPNGQLIVKDYLNGVAGTQQTVAIGTQSLAAATADANGALQLVTTDPQGKLHFWENKGAGWTDTVIPVALHGAGNMLTVIDRVNAYEPGDGYSALVRDGDGTLYLLARESGNVAINRLLTYRAGQWIDGTDKQGLLNQYRYDQLHLALDANHKLLVIGPGGSSGTEYLFGDPAEFANVAPLLTRMTAINGIVEDKLNPITLASLKASSDAWDVDGTVAGFKVTAMLYGTLKIGADADTATPWAAGSNDVIDATRKGFWQAEPNVNGYRALFNARAVDDKGALSDNAVRVDASIAAVNDAPTMARNAALYQIDEDTTSNNGTPVSALLTAAGFADVDYNTGAGIVVVANDADPLTQGVWQFSSVMGWADIGAVAPTAGLVLGANSYYNLRFVPVANYNGTPPALVVHAVDSTKTGAPWSYGTTRVTFDTTTDDATSPVSAMSSTWSIVVRAVNDRPVVANLGRADDQTVKASDDAVLLDLGGDAAVSDLDNANFAGGKLTLAIASGANAADVLGLKTGAHIALSAGTAIGSTVSVDGVVVGTVGTVASGTGLAIDLNADATPERVSTVVQNLTFDTTGTVAGVRVLRLSLADGAGATSNPTETRITVTSNPTLAIASDHAGLKAGQTAQLTLTFSGAPTGFELADLNVSGGAVSDLQPVAGNPLKYTATFTPSALAQDLTASISIDAGKFTDAGNVANLASTPTLIAVDTLAPSVSIVSSTDTVKANDAATLTFTFSEAPVGFASAAIGVSGGQLSNLHATAPDNKTWQATFTPTPGMAVVAGEVKLLAGAYVDAAGNGGAASNVVAIGGDTQAPTVSAAAIQVSGATGPDGTFRIGDTITVSWSGEGNTDIDRVTVDLSRFGGIFGADATFADGKWSASHLIGAGNFDGANADVGITAFDRADNDTTATVFDLKLDSRPPSVDDAAIALSGAATGAGGTYRIGDTITATWTAGGVDDVAGVAMDFSGFGGGSVAAVFGNGKWTASHTIVAAALPAGPHDVKVSVTDDAGNTASAYDSSTPAIDAARPVVSQVKVVGAPAADATSIAFEVTLSEAVSGVDAADFTLSAGGATTADITDISGSGATYIVTVAHIAGNGSLRLDLKHAGTGIVDANGNAIDGGFSAGAVHTVSFNLAPTLGAVDTLTGGVEDTATAISFADLLVASDALDADGAVHAFVVKAVASGTLRIGASAATATAWAAGGNDVVDATHQAFWTPAADAGGAALGAFSVVARDDLGAVSATPVAVKVAVAAVNDAPTLAQGVSLPSVKEDPRENPGASVADLLAASGYADADANDPGAFGIAIAADAADPLAQGHWEYATDAAHAAWHAIGPVSAGAALVLGAAAWLRFVPVADYNGAPGGLTVHAADGTLALAPTAWDGAVETRTTVDLAAADAASPLSNAGVTWNVTVTPVNDKPVISGIDAHDGRTINISDGPALFDANGDALIVDIDDIVFDGLFSAGVVNAAASDVLGLKTDARVTLSAGVSGGSVVSVDGVDIGTVRADSTHALLNIKFGADATPARVSVLLQHLTFDTDEVGAGTRTVGVVVTDKQDSGQKSNAGMVTFTVTTEPTLAISSDKASLTAGETATLTLVFSSAPTGFDLADLTVAGGRVDRLAPTSDPLVFTATFTPDAGAQVLDARISIGAAKFFNGAGLGNLASSAATVIGGDTMAPTMSVTVVGTPAIDAATVQFQVRLNEAVTGLDASDFVLTAGGATHADITGITGSGDTYVVTVANIAGNGSLRLDLKDGGTGILDAAGNAIGGGYTGGAVHTAYFNAAPTITSNDGLAQATILLAEHRAAVTTVAAADGDHDTLVYTIDGGGDAALFAIDAASGALTFKNPPSWSGAPNAANSYEVKVGVTDGHGGSDSQLLTVQVLGDIDRDGIPDSEDDDKDNDGLSNAVDDAVPNAYGSGHGDGNGDNIADSEQINVASVQTAAAGNPFATLEVGSGYTLGQLGAAAAPATLPRGVKMPLGQLDFTIGKVTPGGTVEMSIYVDASLKMNAYYKQDNNGAWKNIAKSVTTVGTKTKITFELTDGGVLDSDRAVNGSISDPGGVAVITPQITSNGGALDATVRVAENGSAVTTVSASAVGAVTYAIVGGEDAALFTIDAHTGVLRFIAAPNYENPRDGGDGAHDNHYVVQVQAQDVRADGIDSDIRSETQTLTVVVTDVDETPPTQETTVDGVKVSTGTQVNADGSTSQVIAIPVVQPSRQDSSGGATVADIPLAAVDGKQVLSAQLPTGYGLNVVGQAAPGTAGDALADLIRAIKAHTAAGSGDQDKLVGGGSGFLGELASTTSLLVQSVTPTSASGASGSDAIVLSGLPATGDGMRTALVIDTSGLSGTTHLQLQNVDFAAIIGAAHVTGGAGSQKVWGDSASQYLVLGADDDTLHGGDGDDTVGSTGGNDHIYGDGGNDVVFGGIGDDHIDGGSGVDTVLMTGASRAGYTLRVKDGMLVSTALHGTDGVDTIVDVEIMRFSGPDTSAAGSIGRLYEAMLGRPADTAGREFWVGQHAAGVSMEAIAAAIVGSGEAQQQQLDDTQFVTRMYTTLLQRGGDSDGMAFWIKQLADGAVTRAGLALAFADSAEKLAMPSSAQLDFNHSDVATLVRMYEALFDRAPDEDGLNFWIGAHESGLAMRTLAQDFLASSESATRYATLDDAHFVAELYQAAFGHGPSAAQAADWAARLAGGATTRADVLLGIADSDEMIEVVGSISTDIHTV